MNEDIDRQLQERLEALPRSIEPQRDLWPAIQARIETGKIERGKVVTGPFESGRPRRPWLHRHGLLAAAASLLVVVSSATTAWWLSTDSTPSAVSAAATAPAGWSEFIDAERAYQTVTDDLLLTLETRRERLAPETVRVVEENLRLIDQAIREARAALERDPANAGLATKVTDIYRRRVDFLKQINRL